MKKSMLIDAAHSEETRIIILENDIIEDIDFESSTKNQHRGNIYLAALGTWISNPLTYVPLYYFNYKVCDYEIYIKLEEEVIKIILFFLKI